MALCRRRRGRRRTCGASRVGRAVQGRRYLHVEDYDAWRGRWLSERLLPAAEAGISIAAWDPWVAAQDRDGEAQLAGVAGWED